MGALSSVHPRSILTFETVACGGKPVKKDNRNKAFIARTAKLFVSIIVCISLALPFPTPSIAQEAEESRSIDKLLALISNASTYGMFVNRDEYSELRGDVLSVDFLEKNSQPTPEEAKQLLNVLDGVESKRILWLERLIANIEGLRESQGPGTLPAVDLVELRTQCGELDEKTVEPIRELFQTLIAGRAVDDNTLKAVTDASIERNECQAHLDRFLAAVAEHADNLQREIEDLRAQIEVKKRECDALPDGTEAEKAAKEQCVVELTVLEDNLKDVQEKYNETKETEASGKDFKIALGILAIIGGIIAAAYGDGVTAIELWTAGAALIESANKKDIQNIERTRSAGVERVIDGAGQASEEEIRVLEESLKQRGLEPVEYENAEAGFSVSIFQGNGTVEVYLSSIEQADGTKAPQLVASLTAANTDVLASSKGDIGFANLLFSKVNGDLFGEKNVVSMNVDGLLQPGGESIGFAVAETSPGSKQFVITIAD